MTADFLIVGGGIGGAVLAELLGRAGRKVVVLEKSTERPQWTRPEILWPATVERLFSLRPRAEWEQEAMLPLQGIQVFNGQRFVTGISRQTFDDAQVQPWSTDPNLTRELLLDSSSFELRRGVEVTEVLKEQGRVVGVRARTVWSMTIIPPHRLDSWFLLPSPGRCLSRMLPKTRGNEWKLSARRHGRKSSKQ